MIRRVGPGALLVLGVAIITGFAFFLFKFKSTPSKHLANTETVAVTTPSPLPVERGNQTTPAANNLDAARNETIVSEDSTQHQSPLPTPVFTSSPLLQPTAITNDNKARDLKLSEAERKSVERERRKAEHKRSRLEAMYKKHEISDEAYKKGQEEYKSEMAKYRSVMDSAASANE